VASNAQENVAAAVGAAAPAGGKKPKKCMYFNVQTQSGCKKGSACPFRHGSANAAPQPSAAAAPAPPVATPRLPAPAATPPSVAAPASAAGGAGGATITDAAAAAKRAQSARLFELLQHNKSASAGAKQQPHASKPATSAPTKPPAPASFKADLTAGLSASFNWQQLVQGSREVTQQRKQAASARRAAEDGEDDDADEGETTMPSHPDEEEDDEETRAKLDRLDSIIRAAGEPAAGEQVAASSAAPARLSRADAFRAAYDLCKSEELQLASLQRQLQSSGGSSAALSSQVALVRSSLRERYRDLLVSHPPRMSAQKSVVNKLWGVIYAEMDKLVAQCKAMQQQARKQQQQGHQQPAPNANIYSRLRPSSSLSSAAPASAAADPTPKLDLFSSPFADEEAELVSRLAQMIDQRFRELDQIASSLHEKYLSAASGGNGGTAGSNAHESSAAVEEAKDDSSALFSSAQPGLDMKVDGSVGVLPSATSTPAPAPAPHSAETIAAVKQLVSSLCVCLGDLERYRQLYVLKALEVASAPLSSSSQPGRPAPSWARCRFFYTRALLLDPESAAAAKSHNQLSVVALYPPLADDGDATANDVFKGFSHFAGLYHYTRALHTPLAPFLPARQNILALYEASRVALGDFARRSSEISTRGSSLEARGARTSLLLAAMVRLLALLDTKIGFEQFDSVRAFATSALKQALNEEFFPSSASAPATAAAGRVSEQTMMRLFLLLLFTLDGLLVKDAAAAGITVSPSAPPAELNPSTAPSFRLSELSGQALGVLYELLSLLTRIPVLLASAAAQTGGQGAASALFAARPVPFLPALALASLWLRSRWGWALAQHDEHAVEDGLFTGAAGAASSAAAGGLDAALRRGREQARSGLAGLASLLSQLQELDGSGNKVATTSEASLLELHGFKPLAQCALWPPLHPPAGAPAVSLDSFSFQCGSVLDYARRVLFVHPTSGRFSARAFIGVSSSSSSATSATVLSAEEAAELQAEQDRWNKAQAARLDAAGNPAAEAAVVSKPKRPSKQAKPRPWMLEAQRAAAAEAGVAASESELAEAAGAVEASSESDDEEEGEMNSASSAATGAAASSSMMESLMSDAALGVKRSPNVRPLPINAASSVAGMSLLDDSASSSSALQPLFLLDGPNLAMRFGLGKVFAVRGIEVALEYVESVLRGRAIVFLPEFAIDMAAVGAKRRAARIGFEVKATCMPDNIGLLQDWQKEGRLVTTPAFDYDDSYVVDYAMRKSSRGEPVFVISNDQYRDHVSTHARDATEAKAMKAWLRSHVVSFTFVQGSFVINPEWKRDAKLGLRRVAGKYEQQQAQQQAQQHAQQQQQQQQQVITRIVQKEPTAETDAKQMQALQELAALAEARTLEQQQRLQTQAPAAAAQAAPAVPSLASLVARARPVPRAEDFPSLHPSAEPTSASLPQPLAISAPPPLTSPPMPMFLQQQQQPAAPASAAVEETPLVRWQVPAAAAAAAARARPSTDGSNGHSPYG